MENNKVKSNNRNFLYSFLFFVLTNVALYFDPDRTRELVFSLPTYIKSKLLFSDLFPAFEYTIDSVIILVTVLLLCSLYFGIQFIRKEPDDRKIFRIIPKSVVGLFTLALVVVGLIYLKMIVFEFIAYL
ncbi:MAG: hypothetical protein WC898_02105 [Candidatus Paceibacterota bacterium]|jgi:hypothetical protein